MGDHPQAGTVLAYGCYVKPSEGYQLLAKLYEVMNMSKFNKIAAGAVTGLAIMAVSPVIASAQPYGGYQRDHDYYRDSRSPYGGQLTSSYVDSLEWRITNAAREGRISWGESRELIGDLRRIQGPMIYRVENGRASPREIRFVTRVVSRIEAETRGYANLPRGPRYGYNGY